MVRAVALSIFITGFLWAEVSAAEIEISAAVDKRTVGVGEELVLSVTVTGGFQNLPSPDLPDMPDFTVYPSGTSTNFSFVNGRVTSSKISRYILVPKREGTLKVPPIAVDYKGSEYTTKELEVTVTASPSPRPSIPSDQGGGEGVGLLVKASVDKSRAYVSEQVTLTLKFYRRVTLLSNRLIPPPTTGFWVEELPGEKEYYAVEGGLQYYVTEIARALFPTTHGELEIGPAVWECVVGDSRGAFGTDPFDLLKRRASRGRSASVRSDPVMVEVLPLPEEGRPVEFNGAVGKFAVKADVDTKSLKVDEPLTLTVTLSGTGNVTAVPDVEMPDIPGLRSYDSGGATDLSRDDRTIRGTKSFSRVYIPSVPGEYSIPPVRLAYFDPGVGDYAIASSEAIPVNVAPAGEGASAGPEVAGPGDAVAKDIRYIKTGTPSFRRAGSRLYKNSYFLLAQLLAPLLVLGAYAYRVAKERSGLDPNRSRAKAAKRRARERLALARSHSAGGRPWEAWKTVSAALRNYIADVAGGSAAALGGDEAAELLEAAGVDERTIRETVDALESCDAAVFAPRGRSAASPEDAIRAASGIIDGIERMRRR